MKWNQMQKLLTYSFYEHGNKINQHQVNILKNINQIYIPNFYEKNIVQYNQDTENSGYYNLINNLNLSSKYDKTGNTIFYIDKLNSEIKRDLSQIHQNYTNNKDSQEHILFNQPRHNCSLYFIYNQRSEQWTHLLHILDKKWDNMNEYEQIKNNIYRRIFYEILSRHADNGEFDSIIPMINQSY